MRISYGNIYSTFFKKATKQQKHLYRHFSDDFRIEPVHWFVWLDVELTKQWKTKQNKTKKLFMSTNFTDMEKKTPFSTLENKNHWIKIRKKTEKLQKSRVWKQQKKYNFSNLVYQIQCRYDKSPECHVRRIIYSEE